MASLGASWSGAARKLSAPVAASIAKRAASAPPVMLNVSVCAGRSGSVAVTVVTRVVFSTTLRVAMLPPPSLVRTGASLVGVTDTVRATGVLSTWASRTVKLTVRGSVLGRSLVLS